MILKCTPPLLHSHYPTRKQAVFFRFAGSILLELIFHSPDKLIQLEGKKKKVPFSSYSWKAVEIYLAFVGR